MKGSSNSLTLTHSNRRGMVLDTLSAQVDSTVVGSPSQLPTTPAKESPRWMQQAQTEDVVLNQVSPSYAVVSPGSKKKSSGRRSLDSGASSELGGITPGCGMRLSLARKALIGKGSYGMVFQAIDRDTNQLIAVKEITLSNSVAHHRATSRGLPSSAERESTPPPESPSDEFKRQWDAGRTELDLLKQLHHPNIVKCLGEECNANCLRIYMEFVAGGSISSLIRKFGPLQERQASNFTRQILQGLEYLHSKGIVHRDLKGDNLLVEPHGTLKLADFGTARDIHSTTACAHAVVGTANFIAPELVSENTLTDVTSDIWSVGCCVIEMLTGSPPLSHLSNQYSIMMLIAETKGDLHHLYIPKDNTWSPEALDFIKQCLQRTPVKRPTAHQLGTHRWILHPIPDENLPQSERSIMTTATPHVTQHRSLTLSELDRAPVSPPSAEWQLRKTERRRKERSSHDRKEKRTVESTQQSPQDRRLESDSGFRSKCSSSAALSGELCCQDLDVALPAIGAIFPRSKSTSPSVAHLSVRSNKGYHANRGTWDPLSPSHPDSKCSMPEMREMSESTSTNAMPRHHAESLTEGPLSLQREESFIVALPKPQASRREKQSSKEASSARRL